MVLGLAESVAAVAKVRYFHTDTDSFVFQIHYRYVGTLCFLASILVTAVDFIGDPIQCLDGTKAVDRAITTYCWISSTFTINSTYKNMEGLGQLKPGIHEKRVHTYYQWVAVVLFLQGCLFYVPHMIWKSYEGKQVDHLLQDLNKGVCDEEAEKKKKNIIHYLKESWGLNMRYSAIYYMCEALNLVNVLGQMFLMDHFLGGFFMNYGSKVISFLNSHDGLRSDPMMDTFPRRAKCIFHRFGSSGSIKKEDVLCILPQNVLNEKIYLIMWIVFVGLAVITAVMLIWRTAVLLSPMLRLKIIEHRMKMRVTPKMEKYIRDMHLGDFCLLETISYNLDLLSFREVLHGLKDNSPQTFSASAPPSKDENYRAIYPTLNGETLPRQRHTLDFLEAEN